ncbi:hypothetical protein CEXT_664911 [Caerostris extrusa]|uniref:Uncharacterized protein n=1 Tax=Caerostris extrusa TaxID=172846 RepID=A0AAV4SZM8_CAEEX|nr:hypothetical protein CEXT_664911 [Caerostris extrusa]
MSLMLDASEFVLRQGPIWCRTSHVILRRAEGKHEAAAAVAPSSTALLFAHYFTSEFPWVWASNFCQICRGVLRGKRSKELPILALKTHGISTFLVCLPFEAF